MSHTTGPWEIVHPSGGYVWEKFVIMGTKKTKTHSETYGEYVSESPVTIARVQRTPSAKEAEANARLIASAPEMRACLIRARVWLKKALADEIHLSAAAPQDLPAVVEWVDNLVDA